MTARWLRQTSGFSGERSSLVATTRVLILVKSAHLRLRRTTVASARR
jgi:hypothetical protein